MTMRAGAAQAGDCSVLRSTCGFIHQHRADARELPARRPSVGATGPCGQGLPRARLEQEGVGSSQRHPPLLVDFGGTAPMAWRLEIAPGQPPDTGAAAPAPTDRATRTGRRHVADILYGWQSRSKGRWTTSIAWPAGLRCEWLRVDHQGRRATHRPTLIAEPGIVQTPPARRPLAGSSHVALAS